MASVRKLLPPLLLMSMVMPAAPTAHAGTGAASAADVPASIAPVAPDRLDEAMRGLALQHGHEPGRRIEVTVGSIDTRLRLAPCQRIEPLWPAGTRAWGRIRVALRCVEGPTPWKVYVPVTIKVFGPASVAGEALPAGTVLQPRHLRVQDVNLAEGTEPPLSEAAAAMGRTLARALAPGQALRASDLRQQQWFTAGDVVRIVARGDGYQVHGEGTALDAGVDGRNARVRTESGRIVSGRAVATRQIELSL